jgi:hypothetical protein
MTERRVQITVGREKKIDVSRVEEFVRANFDDGDQVQILDIKTGESYYDNIGSDTL